MRCGAMVFAVTVLAAGVDAQPNCQPALDALDVSLLGIGGTYEPALTACQHNGRSLACQAALTSVETTTTGTKELMKTVAATCHPGGDACQQIMHNGTELLNGGLVNLQEAKKNCAAGNETMCVAYITASSDDVAYAILEIVLGNVDCVPQAGTKPRRATPARRTMVRNAGRFTGASQCQNELVAANTTVVSLHGDLDATEVACAISGASPGCANHLDSTSSVLGKAAAQIQTTIRDCTGSNGRCSNDTNTALNSLYVVVAHVNTAQMECPKNNLICAMELLGAQNNLVDTFANLEEARDLCN